MEKKSYQVTGLVLCGGKGTRLGGQNKGLLAKGDRLFVLDHIQLLKPFCKQVLVNNNEQLDEYKKLNIDSIKDIIQGYVGPLAGIHSGLSYMSENSTHLLVIAVDYPYLTPDMIQRLITTSQAYPNKIIACYHQRSHPLIAIFPAQYKASINEYLIQHERRVIRFLQQKMARYVDCSDVDEKLFININNPEQLQQL